MIELILTLGTALIPVWFVIGLLLLAGWRDRRLEAVSARQIRLTDAIAEELGAVVAPVVRRRRGIWRVEMAVPFGRPVMVGRVLAISQRTLDRMTPGRYEIVLTPQEPVTQPIGRPAVAAARLRVA